MLPIVKTKYDKKSIINPSDLFKYRKKHNISPSFKNLDGVIICYNRKQAEHIANKFNLKKSDGFRGDAYIYKEHGETLALSTNFGIGAPIATLLLEEYIALGIKKFITIGTAGTLQKNIKYQDFVLCDKAIRDEGTSYHYIKQSKFSYSSKKLFSLLKNELCRANSDFYVGTTWTTDAPYRETIDELHKFQLQNVLIAEMEAAALFAVAKYRDVDLASLFVVSDSLAQKEWAPQYHNLNSCFEKMFDFSVKTLLHKK
ncbi:MAG: nucleoside phosphorylase [Parcubacteria group bacterium]